MRMTRNMLVAVIAAASVGWSCGGSTGKVTAREIWRDVLSRCAESDLLGKNVLFMGSSSTLGPGTILRKTTGGGYTLRWNYATVAYPTKVVQPGASASCKGTSSSTAKITPSVDVGALVPGLSAGVAADVKRGREVTVTIGNWQMDQLEEGAAEAAIKGKKISLDVWNDLQVPVKLVVSKGILIRGITAEISFDSSTAASLKAKYAQPAPVSVGVGLEGSWTESGKLKIASTQDVYIAAELANIATTGFSGPANMFAQEKNLDAAQLEPQSL